MRLKSKFVFLFVLVLTINYPLQAVIPPLSKEELRLQSSHVLTGYVFQVQEKIEMSGNYTDVFYTAKMIVHDSEQGDFKQKNVIQFSFWRALSRPSGWIGRTGQYAKIGDSKTVRVWLGQKEDGRLYLLEPNGWEYVDYAGRE